MEERWGNQKNLVAGPQFGDSVLSLIPWTWSKSYRERRAADKSFKNQNIGKYIYIYSTRRTD